LHDGGDDGSEYRGIRFVVDAIFKGNVGGVTSLMANRMVLLATADADVVEISCAWEETFSKFVEGDGHYAIGGIKCPVISLFIGKSLFNTITMVNVDVNIQNTTMIFQQLENCKDNVIHITKPRRSIALCMVKSSRPTNLSANIIDTYFIAISESP
jgi:hypothetical protein